MDTPHGTCATKTTATTSSTVPRIEYLDEDPTVGPHQGTRYGEQPAAVPLSDVSRDELKVERGQRTGSHQNPHTDKDDEIQPAYPPRVSRLARLVEMERKLPDSRQGISVTLSNINSTLYGNGARRQGTKIFRGLPSIQRPRAPRPKQRTKRGLEQIQRVCFPRMDRGLRLNRFVVTLLRRRRNPLPRPE